LYRGITHQIAGNVAQSRVPGLSRIILRLLGLGWKAVRFAVERVSSLVWNTHISRQIKVDYILRIFPEADILTPSLLEMSLLKLS
jgi:hypothetical protein